MGRATAAASAVSGSESPGEGRRFGRAAESSDEGEGGTALVRVRHRDLDRAGDAAVGDVHADGVELELGPWASSIGPELTIRGRAAGETQFDDRQDTALSILKSSKRPVTNLLGLTGRLVIALRGIKKAMSGV
jgi:hypothetical protein